MSSENRLVRYVQIALERQEAGDTVDLEVLCREDPDLVDAVREALDLAPCLNAPRSPDPLLGAVLDGRYALESVLGSGAMGVVYGAADRSLQRDVAVKVLQPGVLASPTRRERFAREARVLASLDHPNIVTVHDHGQTEQGLHYLVMARLRGCSLAQVLEEAERESERESDGPSPHAPWGPWLHDQLDAGTTLSAYLPQVVTWMAELAAALEMAHRSGVLHRDVKPSNICITGKGTAVLLDFGIATRDGDVPLTLGGTTLGTPWYMAPEQVTDAANITAAVDIYGLCATLYHVVTFRPPYDGDYAEVLARLPSEDPRPPGAVRRDLPRDLCAIVEKGMEREPARRYASARELREDLLAFLSHMPLRARPISRVGRVLRRVRRRPAPAITALALAGSIALTVLLTSIWRNRELAAEAQYENLFAALNPSLAIEGSLAERSLMDPDKRQRDIELLDRILELRPDDVYSRLLRSALWQDQGRSLASASDLELVGGGEPSAYLSAVVERFAGAPPAEPGIGAVDLRDLPEPAGATDHLVAGFLALRTKDYPRADALLQQAAGSLPARYVRLNAMFHLARIAPPGDGRQEQLDATRREALDLARRLGFETAKTSYYVGSVLAATGDYESALFPLRNAQRLCPDSFGPHFQLAVAYLQTARLDDADTAIHRAIEQKPWLLNAKLQLAQIKRAQLKLDEAMAIAEAMPDTGRLIEPWHRAYLMGWIESARLHERLFNEDEPGARAAAEAAIAHFRRAAERTAPGDEKTRNSIQGSIVTLRIFLDGDDQPLFSGLLHQVRQAPLDPSLLFALAAHLKRRGNGAALQDDFRRILLLQARSLARDNRLLRDAVDQALQDF